uniref:Hypothetical secreted peptide n=1 Tax=Simulium guianense TaxID=445764 RepID=F5GTQ0_SIMGU
MSLKRKNVVTKILLSLIVLMSILALANGSSLGNALKSGIKQVSKASKNIAKKPVGPGTVPAVKPGIAAKPLPSPELVRQNMDKVIAELKTVLAKRNQMKMNLPKNLP